MPIVLPQLPIPAASTNLPLGIARYLNQQGLVTLDETGTNGDCYLQHVPQTPGQLVSITEYAGPAPDALLGYDEPRIQIRVRGTQDPTVSQQRAQTILDALHGLHDVTLADGTYLADCLALASGPQSLGQDSNNRWEHVINLHCEVRNVSNGRQ